MMSIVPTRSPLGRSALTPRPRTRPAALASLLSLTAAVLLSGLAPSAAVAAPSPGWAIDSQATPSTFSTADEAKCVPENTAARCDIYRVTVRNAGEMIASSGAVTITDTLPAGVTVRQIKLLWSGSTRLNALAPGQFFANSDLNILIPEKFGEFGLTAPCTSAPVQCTFPALLAEGGFGIQPDDTLEMQVIVGVADPTPRPLKNEVTVSGGGGQEAAATATNQLGGAQAPFGLSDFAFEISGPDGQPATQAASHPYEATSRIDFANLFRVPPDSGNGGEEASGAQDAKDVVVDLPLGFLGDALATPTCTFAELSSRIEKGVGGCPPGTVVGHITTQPQTKADSIDGQIYNMVPEQGVPAEFAFVDGIAGPHVLYTRVVPTPAGYVLQTTAPDLPQITLTGVTVTFFGNPAAKQEELALREGKQASGNVPTAFFTLPSRCGGEELVTSVHVDTWQHPGRLNADGTPDLTDPSWVSAQSASPPVTGCNSLQFRPEAFSFRPETATADAATGAEFNLQVPQNEQPGTLATPPLRNDVVKLPAGLIVNPAAAPSLASCSEQQIGWLGGSKTNFTASPPTCPDASKIGSVLLTSPLISGQLPGYVYLASQNENPFGSVLAGYIVVDDRRTGVVVKIPGRLSTDPATGQITGSFEENPQLPFSALKLRFFGGELATPESCGAFTTTSLMAPWSFEDSGPAATLSDAFSITGNCSPGFAPSFTAGTASPQAGGYSPFTLSFSRQDNEQEISGLTVSLPPGLLAKIAGVGQCSDAQLAAAAANPSAASEKASPSCPAASLLGTVQAGAGAGEPFFLPGKAYLTGPYKGAPYGLAVIVPAAAGPFDLGNVVVRSQLRIDPNDAHATAVSDPFPTILNVKHQNAEGQPEEDGFPIRMRRVDVTLDRPQFTLNPTSCTPMSISATLTSTQGVTAPESSRFQAAGCGELPFKPSFSAATQGKASKANGASLTVSVTQKPGEADIRKVELQIPKALPSRLSTLQKACTLAQFESNPAGCPEGSFIGTATAHTPILGVPLSGPAILVSHGGAAFPDVEFLLQGEGVHITLDGKTDIKKGITYSRFETVPDAPISSFETILPTGPHSVLGSYVPGSNHYNFCGTNLTLPTTITAQNGAVLTQTTKLGVTGCPPSVAIVKTKVNGNSVAVTVKLGQQGTVKITGRGLRTTIKRGMKAGTRTITVPLTAVGRAAKRRRGKLKIQAALTVAGKTGTATTTLKA